MLPQCDDLQRALCGEDDDEAEVDPVQDHFFLCTLLVCLHHHGDHVEANQHHDEDIEELLGDQVKDQTLELVLVRQREESV